MKLRQYVGAEIASTLERVARDRRYSLEVPAQLSRYEGYTGAAVYPLFVIPEASDAVLVMMKRLRRDQLSEIETHRAAYDSAPPAFQGHLVSERFLPASMPDGGALMFQALAGRSVDFRPAADLGRDRLAEIGARLVRCMIQTWTATPRPSGPVLARDHLRTELARASSLGRHLPGRGAYGRDGGWVRTAEDGVLADPAALGESDSLLRDFRINVIRGRSHGDLHMHNLLFRQRGDQTNLDDFVLVDLATYSANGPLDRDPVTLLLSIATGLLEDCSPRHRTELLHAFVTPERRAVVPIGGADALYAIYGTASELLAECGDHVWRRQYLLSLVAHGLMFTTFELLPPESRWWCYRLAGHAGRQLAAEACGDQVPCPPPQDAPLIRNPFPASASRPARAPTNDGTMSSKGEPRLSGRVRLELCRRLGDGWLDLAIFLDVPGFDRDRFRGDEAAKLLDWVDNRRRHRELPDALRAIGRHDLADLVEGASGWTDVQQG